MCSVLYRTWKAFRPPLQAIALETASLVGSVGRCCPCEVRSLRGGEGVQCAGIPQKWGVTRHVFENDDAVEQIPCNEWTGCGVEVDLVVLTWG